MAPVGARPSDNMVWPRPRSVHARVFRRTARAERTTCSARPNQAMFRNIGIPVGIVGLEVRVPLVS